MKHSVRCPRLILAASSLIVFFASESVWAGAPAVDRPIPRSLLLEYLADRSTFTLIDARSPDEFAASHITGAINIAHDSTGDILASLPPDLDAPIVVYCTTGKRAGLLRTKLIERGYTNVRVLLPEQIVWFDDMAVFNCATSGAGQAVRTISNLIIEGKREGIQ